MNANANTETNTDLATVAELYVPTMDDNGNYVDGIIPKINGGIRCSCGSKTVFMTKSTFKIHSNTQIHKNWIESLNTNRANYYVETLKQKEIIENQKLIIQQQSKKIQIKNYVIQEKEQTINYFRSQLNKEVDSGKISFIDM
jgi:hypothetical protein